MIRLHGGGAVQRGERALLKRGALRFRVLPQIKRHIRQKRLLVRERFGFVIIRLP